MYQLDEIQASGLVLELNHVDQLVNAMAAFDTPDGVGDVISEETKNALQVELAQTWS